MSTHMTNDLENKEDGQVAGLINEALAPVEAPAAVKRRLRDEILEVARQKTEKTIRLEPDKRASTWVIGAAVGTIVALASGVWLVLRNRMLDDSGTPGREARD
jgi:hypothetical protein